MHYRVKQAGAEEVRILRVQVNTVQALLNDIGLVQGKLSHHQRVNGAQFNEDTPEHQAQREGDAEALDITEAFQARPTCELADLTRELDKAQALQAIRVTIYTDFAALDTLEFSGLRLR